MVVVVVVEEFFDVKFFGVDCYFYFFCMSSAVLASTAEIAWGFGTDRK